MTEVRTELMQRLQNASDADLAALLAARPDLATPAPTSTSALVVRALGSASTRRALAQVPAPALRAAETIAIGHRGATATELGDALGIESTAAEGLLQQLRRLALVVGAELVPAAATALRETPWHELTLGLGPPLAELAELTELAEPAGDAAPAPVAPTTPAALHAVLADAPPAAAAMVRALARGPATGSHEAGGEPEAVGWLLDHHLVYRLSPTQVVLPREVGLAVRAPQVGDPAPEQPPLPAGHARTQETVTAEAVENVETTVRTLTDLLTWWSREPAHVLRSGGLGVRDLRTAATRLEVSTEEVALAAQLADAAGLLGRYSADDADLWAPTPEADAWFDQETGDQWARLVQAWLEQTQVSWLVGTPTAKGAIRAALTPDTDRSWAPGLRRQIVAAMAAWPPGGAPDTADLLRHLAWWAPRSAPPQSSVEAILAEAEQLGLVAAGALSVLGRALHEGSDLAHAWQQVVPAPVEELILQGDLTGIVPGRPSHELDQLVQRAAVVESHGHGRTVRFTPDSVASALNYLTAEDLVERLRQHSLTPVPQALEYLIQDAARRYASVRVGSAQSYVRGEEAELAALVAAGQHRLRLLAPTVAVSDLDPASLVTALRTHGLSAVAESATGEVVVPHERGLRATRGRRRPEPSAPAPIEQVLAQLRSGDQREASLLSGAETSAELPVSHVAVLDAAAAHGRRVEITVALGAGQIERRQVQVLSVDHGRLRLRDIDRDTEIVVAAHRLVQAVPLS